MQIVLNNTTSQITLGLICFVVFCIGFLLATFLVAHVVKFDLVHSLDHHYDFAGHVRATEVLK